MALQLRSLNLSWQVQLLLFFLFHWDRLYRLSQLSSVCHQPCVSVTRRQPHDWLVNVQLFTRNGVTARIINLRRDDDGRVMLSQQCPVFAGDVITCFLKEAADQLERFLMQRHVLDLQDVIDQQLSFWTQKHSLQMRMSRYPVISSPRGTFPNRCAGISLQVETSRERRRQGPDVFRAKRESAAYLCQPPVTGRFFICSHCQPEHLRRLLPRWPEMRGRRGWKDAERKCGERAEQDRVKKKRLLKEGKGWNVSVLDAYAHPHSFECFICPWWEKWWRKKRWWNWHKHSVKSWEFCKFKQVKESAGWK